MRGAVASQSRGVTTVEAGDDVRREDDHEARGGSGHRGSANAALVGAATGSAVGSSSDSKGSSTYGIVFVVTAVVLAYGVIKLRRASA